MFDSPESFIEWSEPTGVTTGAKKDEPKQGEPKVWGTSTSSPPCNTWDHIYAQCAWIHCRKKENKECERKKKEEHKDSEKIFLKTLYNCTYSSKACKLCAPAADGVQEFPLQCSGKSTAWFLET